MRVMSELGSLNCRKTLLMPFFAGEMRFFFRCEFVLGMGTKCRFLTSFYLTRVLLSRQFDSFFSQPGKTLRKRMSSESE